MSWTVHNSEITKWAAEEEERILFGESDQYHAVLCDPPYGLEFMGKEWDSFSKPGIGERQTEWPSFTSGSANPTCAKCNGRQRGAKKCKCDIPEWKPIVSDNPTYGKTEQQQREIFQEAVRKWGQALLPILYPGALVFVFGGTRMFHRLAAGMEDAGFYLWDTLLWLHGQGFPKWQALDSMIDAALGKKDERKQIGVKEAGIGTGKNHGHHQRENGRPESMIIPVTATATAEGLPWRSHKTCALKPAWEPVLCFRTPDGGATYAELAMKYGSGALNVDAGRIGITGGGGNGLGSHMDALGNTKPLHKHGEDKTDSMGRYPANLALECTCEEVEVVDAPGQEFTTRGNGSMFGANGNCETVLAHGGGKALRHTDPSCPAFQLDEQAENKVHSAGSAKPAGGWSSIGGWGFIGQDEFGGARIGDSVGPSRFFYCAKASRSERDAGLTEMARKPWAYAVPEDDGYVPPFAQHGVANNHPTVKPIDLNRWLATLLLPPDSVKPRRILVPFAGVASEMIGCLVAGWDEVVGVEMSPEYCKIAEARLAHWEQFKDRPEAARLVKAESGAAQPSLFG